MDAAQVANFEQPSRPRGRPSVYDPKYCDLLIEYFEAGANAPVRELAAIEIDESGYDQKGSKGSQKREVRKICAELPTVEGFSRSIGIPSGTVKDWSRDHVEFSIAYARAKDIQKAILVDRGLTRQYDPTAFLFVAKNITDMTDKASVELTGANGAALTSTTIIALAQSMSPEQLLAARERLQIASAPVIEAEPISEQGCGDH